MGRHQAERVLNSEVPCIRYFDRSDREDVRLHQPRSHNASQTGGQWVSFSPTLVESDLMNRVLSEDQKAITIPRCGF